MNVTCSEELLSLVLRTHPNGGGFGDPYDLVITVTGDEGVATIKGLVATPSTAHLRAVFAKLRDLGFHTVRWTRHRHDGIREVRSVWNGTRWARVDNDQERA